MRRHSGDPKCLGKAEDSTARRRLTTVVKSMHMICSATGLRRKVQQSIERTETAVIRYAVNSCGEALLGKDWQCSGTALTRSEKK